jgi:glycosyltransferase involved in cell wall biosynthesis
MEGGLGNLPARNLRKDCDMDERKLVFSIVCGDNSGPAYHDIFIPCKYYEKYKLFESHLQFNLDPTPLQASDIIMFQRQYAAEALMLVRQMRAKGKTVLALVDDNMWEIPKSNPAYNTYKGITMQRMEQILTEASGGLTSTETIRQHMLRFNQKSFVQRNLVEPEITNFLTPGRDNPDEIRIGWTGTPHHFDDVLAIKPVFRAITQKYPQVKWIFMGWEPPWRREVIPDDRFEFYAFVPVDAFYSCLANLDFDIGIAPLADNGFNRGKTARKAQEYSILRIPMVLSDVEPYRAYKHGVEAMVPRNNSLGAWIEFLSELIESKEKRDSLVEGAYAHVMANHDINKFIKERADTMINIWKEEHNG